MQTLRIKTLQSHKTKTHFTTEKNNSATFHMPHLTNSSFHFLLLILQARDHEDQVSMWKDHSQTASTTSLSIVQVALLKTVLDLDPDQVEHYYVTLTFIIINIILSVTSAALVLVLYVIRYNLSKMVRCMDVQNQNQMIKMETKNEDTEANVTEIEEQAAETVSQEVSNTKPPVRSFSEFYSNLCMQEMALQMVLSDLLEDGDESEDYQKRLSSVLKRLRSVKRQRSLVRSKTVKQKQESHRTYTAVIQTVITLMMFLSTICNMFIVVFGFISDEGTPGSLFSGFNTSTV